MAGTSGTNPHGAQPKRGIGLGGAQSAYDGAVSGARRSPFSGGTLMMTVMMLVFLVAVVFAANQNEVIGWIVAIVAGGWLILAVAVFLAVRRAAKFGATQLATANDTIRNAAGLAPNADAAPRSSTRVVKGSGADSIRDEKLAHSFKIIQVQNGVIGEYLDTDRDQVDRARETIDITAHNALGLLGGDKSSDGAKRGKASKPGRAGDDDVVTGNVVD